jgi:hypothetical protein
MDQASATLVVLTAAGLLAGILRLLAGLLPTALLLAGLVVLAALVLVALTLITLVLSALLARIVGVLIHHLVSCCCCPRLPIKIIGRLRFQSRQYQHH